MKNQVNNYALALLLYLSMISGGIIPLFHEGGEKAFVKLAVAVSAATLIGLSNGKIYAKVVIFAYCILSTLILLPSFLLADNFEYALEKFDAVVFGVSLSTALFALLVARLGLLASLAHLILVGFFVLLLTIIYKFQFGFFDRSVRFFLNGPNVFGWLMGFLAVTSFFSAIAARRPIFFWGGFLFLVAVLWSESKGALLSTVFASALLFLMQLKKKKYFYGAISLALGCVIMLPSLAEFIKSNFPDSRLLALFRLFEGSLTDVDAGSIGVRQYLIDDAIDAFSNEPISGIGLGNFEFHSSLGFAYPHNAHIEVFMECGVFVGIAYVIFIIWGLWKSGSYFRLVALYFLMASSFSGDIGYLRYGFIFLIAGAMYSSVRRVLPSHNQFVKSINYKGYL